MLKTAISVVIAVENRVRVLPIMLSCMEKQTLPAAYYEIIFVLYGRSTTEDLDLAQHYAAGAPMPVKCLYAPSSSEVHAKNVGAFSARGACLLFLDQDLLAGPRLLATHLDIHRRNSVRAIVQGAVQRNKSLPPGSLTRWFMDHDTDLMDAGKPDVPFYWSSRHSSLPHAFFIDGGGFNESYEACRAADIELLQRIMRNSCAVLTLPGNHAFIWHEAQFDEERRRFWREGFDLYRLAHLQNNSAIIYHFRLRRSPLRFWIEDMFMPFYIKTCQETPLDVRIHGRSYQRVFAHECCRGSLAAMTGSHPAKAPESIPLTP